MKTGVRHYLKFSVLALRAKFRVAVVGCQTTPIVVYLYYSELLKPSQPLHCVKKASIHALKSLKFI